METLRAPRSTPAKIPSREKNCFAKLQRPRDGRGIFGPPGRAGLFDVGYLRRRDFTKGSSDSAK